MFAILIYSKNCVCSSWSLLKCDIASATSSVPSALHCSGNRVIKREIISPNDCISFAHVITFTSLLIVSLLTCHHISFWHSPKEIGFHFVLYAFRAITNLRDPEIDTKCLGRCLSLLLYNLQLPGFRFWTERETEIFPAMLFVSLTVL